MSEGIVYYNSGRKMLVRLAVSLHTLRIAWPDVPVTIIWEGGRDIRRACHKIASRWDAQILEAKFKTTAGRGRVYLNATLVHEVTPYDPTIWLDSDTVVLRPFPEMFEAARKNEFAIAHFANWLSAHGSIAKRIRAWEPLYPDWIQPALELGPAINCGVFSFRRDSKLMADWWKLAEPGREFSWIPDETCCQLILPQYPHEIMPPVFNVSCRYGLPEHFEQARVIHFHGRKHCRQVGDKFIYHGEIWWTAFERIRHERTIQSYIEHDRHLEKAAAAICTSC